MKIVLVFVTLIIASLCLSVSGDVGEDEKQIDEWEEGYYPRYPLDPVITWEGNISLEAGYPLVQHSFAPFTPKEWKTFGIDKVHTIRILPYENPPLFPNNTIYAIYHPILETMPWLIEMKNPVTGDDMLAQVASTPKGKYNPQISPLENDLQNNIGWYVVDGTLYPRTWISGHFSEGQTWSEYWGPFEPDINGSRLKKRTYQIIEKEVEFNGKKYQGYIVRITGPHIIADVKTDMVEELTLVDGVGVIKRLLTHTAAEPFIRNSTITGKQMMPKGTMIFRHLVTMYSMNTS